MLKIWLLQLQFNIPISLHTYLSDYCFPFVMLLLAQFERNYGKTNLFYRVPHTVKKKQ